MVWIGRARSPASASMKAMLRQRAFRTLWIAQFVSIFGDFIALFGVISLITFRLHGTAVDVTSVVIAYILPPALIGPFSGVLVDRWNVKRVMIASDLCAPCWRPPSSSSPTCGRSRSSSLH